MQRAATEHGAQCLAGAAQALEAPLAELLEIASPAAVRSAASSCHCIRSSCLASVGAGYHLYVSKSNPGAEALARDLAAEVGQKEGSLRWTTDEAEKESGAKVALRTDQERIHTSAAEPTR